jgi:hypothetical protein
MLQRRSRGATEVMLARIASDSLSTNLIFKAGGPPAKDKGSQPKQTFMLARPAALKA